MKKPLLVLATTFLLSFVVSCNPDKIENNLCGTLTVRLISLSWNDAGWVEYSPGIFKKEIQYSPPCQGTYILRYSFQETPPWNLATPGVSVPFQMTIGKDYFGPYNTNLVNTKTQMEGYVTFEIPKNRVGETITLSWLSSVMRIPEHTITLELQDDSKKMNIEKKAKDGGDQGLTIDIPR